MSTWIVSDLHGCGESFEKLRTVMQFDPTEDTLYLVGDLVNRGPRSLETLRWIVEHKHCVHAVLGNHDLHLLWCALGAGMPKGRDTLYDILHAPDAEALISWLRTQPFARLVGDTLIVHAGIHPRWTIEETLEHSERLQGILSGAGAGRFLDRMRARHKEKESDAADFDAIDVFTRMRTLVRGSQQLDETYSGTLAKIPSHLQPWFRALSPHPRPKQVFFGHWAALGFHEEAPYIGIDTGCIWGGGLTAWRLEDGVRIFQPALDEPVKLTDGQRRANAPSLQKL